VQLTEVTRDKLNVLFLQCSRITGEAAIPYICDTIWHQLEVHYILYPDECLSGIVKINITINCMGTNILRGKVGFVVQVDTDLEQIPVPMTANGPNDICTNHKGSCCL